MGYYKDQKNKRQGQKRGNDRLSWDDYRLVRVELTAKDRTNIRENYADLPDVEGCISALWDGDCKLSISASDEGKTIVASLTQRDAAHVNAGLTLTGRGSDVLQAMRVLFYKAMILGDGKSWAQVEAELGGGEDYEMR